MDSLQQFHVIASDMLQHLGFSKIALLADQKILGLEVDERFSIHFELMDDAYWLMHADLGPAQRYAGIGPILRLRHEQIGQWQPSFAFDEDDQLQCWLLLPLQGLDLPALLDAFDAVVVTAEHILNGADLIAEDVADLPAGMLNATDSFSHSYYS